MPSGARLVALLLLLAPRTQAGCPEEDEVLARLGSLGLERAARTQVFGHQPPWSLYEKALRKREAVAERRKQEGFGVALVDLPADLLWRALNDHERQARCGYVPVQHAEVLGPTEDGQGVLVAQLFKRLGVGRWWINEVRPHAELHQASGGTLRELRWHDRMDSIPAAGVPDTIREADVRAIRESRGAWLLASVGPECTLIEYFTRSDPGGALSSLQWLLAGPTIRATVQGMIELAQAYDSGREECSTDTKAP